jgi:hypothetical protein
MSCPLFNRSKILLPRFKPGTTISPLYKKAFLARPISMKAQDNPGIISFTLPLYILPTLSFWSAQNISTNLPFSTTATLDSQGYTSTIISLSN